MYCEKCGSEVTESQSFCQECGFDLEKEDKADVDGKSDSYTFIFALMDSWERHRTSRVLVDLALIFISAGIWLGIILGESLDHYYKLNRGHVEPFDEEEDSYVWTTLLK